MSTSRLIVNHRNNVVDLMGRLMADLTDADLMVRPAPEANHMLWQLTHLTRSQVMLAGLVSPEAPVAVPAHFDEAGKKAAAASDDPATFPTRAEVMDVLGRAHAAIVAGVTGMTDQQLAGPSPEPMRKMGPELADILLMVGGTHMALHIGQLQVLRRKLGKPIMF